MPRRALLSVLLACGALAQPTAIEHPAAADQLMGEHLFNLQWIDSPAGLARVTERPRGELWLEAEQRNQKGDSASVRGRIRRITEKAFELEGVIITQVSHNFGGQPCVRKGRFTFRMTGKRRYWRLKEMANCEGKNLVDYVDVYVARPAPKP